MDVWVLKGADATLCARLVLLRAAQLMWTLPRKRVESFLIAAATPLTREQVPCRQCWSLARKFRRIGEHTPFSEQVYLPENEDRTFHCTDDFAGHNSDLRRRGKRALAFAKPVADLHSHKVGSMSSTPSPEQSAVLGARRPLVAAAAALLAFLAMLASASDLLPWASGFDQAIHAWIVTDRSPGLTAAASVITKTASSAFTAPLVFIVAAALTPGPFRAKLNRAVLVLLLMLLAVLTRYAISELIARPRPPTADWAVDAGGLSFPSGHTSDATLAAGLIAWLVVRRFAKAPRWLVWALAAAYAVLIAWTRVYLGVHWPTDVLGSLAFVTVWLSGALALQRLDERDTHSQFIA